MKPIIKIENLSKQYRLGTIGTGTISNDLKRWWHQCLGKEDPFLKIGESNDRSVKGGSEYVWALRDINLEVLSGEVLGIIGKNGAGKSTLLKILSKVTGPTTGSISFNGRIGSLLEVGTGFHQELTGLENIYLNGAILGMTKTEIKKKLDEIIDFSGCERYIDTPVKRYSSGMTVRLGFAVAAHLEPEILVVDEVLAVGDAEFQKKAIGKMQDVSKNNGRTVLFVSHNMASISQLCSKTLILENSKIKLLDTTDKVITYYLKSTKDLIQENLLSIKERHGNGNVQFKSFSIENNAGEIIQDILTGQTVTFCFAIEVASKNKEKIDLGFSIHSDQENTVSILYSSYQNAILETSRAGTYVVKCQLQEFPISEGSYTIGGRIMSNGVESDWPEIRIGEFTVIKGDFYKTGNLAVWGKSQVLIKGSWDIQN